MESSTGDGGRRQPPGWGKLGRPLFGTSRSRAPFCFISTHALYRCTLLCIKSFSWSNSLTLSQGFISRFGSSNKRTIKILKDVSGIIKPARMTLLLGPPASGKSTLMRALTGKPAKNLKVSGNITYCGHTFSEFYPERTSAYVSQYDLHNGEMTVRETMDFSRRCLGIGARYDMLSELARRERNAGIKPDPEIDALMKATAVEGKETNIMTDLVLKVLGLDICADIIVGDEMKRGISGGQKKRVTTGEMLTGPAKALFMDEISTGLDSSSTFQIAKYIRQMVHVMNYTVMISLLQPPPETYNLFDDIILLSEGHIVYHGPQDNILEFFESAGFRCPERKGVADFLQEVTSRKDQQQYWFHNQEHYRYVSVPEFVQHFKTFHAGQKLQKELQVPYDKYKTHPAALTTKKFFSQFLAYFLTHQMAVAMFRLLGAILKTMVVANTFGMFTLLIVFLFGGFLLPRPGGNSSTVIADDDDEKDSTNQAQMSQVTHDMNGAGNRRTQTGMILPFQPLSLSFNHMNYYVDMPDAMKEQGFTESRLQLLSDISGIFRPGVLTALVGVSGAGKTTLMDVLAGRKTSGTIEGDIKLSGYPKKQETFARISGYCEQTDIHSPNVTVYESLLYSAWLRLSSEVDENTRKMFVDEVMSLVELDVLRNALVGLPGVSGLSTEQRKRLTIAVELVANPSIIFMDEPTSGLDARAAAIVMRTAIPGVPKITEGYNPATWMLEVSSPLAEARLNVDFAEIYANSALYRSNQELIKELSIPPSGYQDISFPTKYAQNFLNQFMANAWKQSRSYWKNPPYNAMRYLMTALYAIVFGTVFWRKGKNVENQEDLVNLLGATYAAVFFLGAANLLSCLPVFSIERTVFYREKAAGMYSPLSYAFALTVVEFVYNTAQGILYTLPIYAMVGYEWKADKFFYFLFFISASFIYFTLFGAMLIACTPSQMLASILVSFTLTSWNIFAGFLIARPAIPVWWRWFYWTDPVSWTIYGVIASQFGDLGRKVNVPGSAAGIVVKDFLKRSLGYKHDFLGYIVLAHFGYIILFLFLFAYGTKALNFQKR
ncbi:hypothetical protein PR202_gb21016 [Eleusine coracana subsp. coracana]|uniref:ABC transporter domain-containing protein n=1 Tax=Eleusine coracana subsp. coracana TaxID=191504 RepID=A0AAV5FC60_ELECO|nr:hypothetical protein PR202_gb21016 [Eleusine coracana subsp. coracana]